MRFSPHGIKPFRGFPHPDFTGFEHGCQSRPRGVRRDLNPLFFCFLAIKSDADPFCMRNFLTKGSFFHKKVSQSLGRRFVGFVEPSNQRSFCVFRTDQGRQPREEQYMRKPTRPLARRIDERQPAPYQQISPEPVFCNEHERCQGCPYPRHGIVCWHRDGTCLRTDMEEIGRRQKL